LAPHGEFKPPFDINSYSNLAPWSRGMSDENGPFVAAAVYRELCAKNTITADDIAYASLDTAVGELRAQNVGPDRWALFVHIGA
jgi:hypothetical protein